MKRLQGRMPFITAIIKTRDPLHLVSGNVEEIARRDAHAVRPLNPVILNNSIENIVYRSLAIDGILFECFHVEGVVGIHQRAGNRSGIGRLFHLPCQCGSCLSISVPLSCPMSTARFIALGTKKGRCHIRRPSLCVIYPAQKISLTLCAPSDRP